MSDPMVQIRYLLKRLNRRVESIVEKDYSKSGLTLSQIMVLRQINEEPKTIGNISKNLGLSNGTVSGVVDRLEKEDLVERIRDIEDRRVVWIHKTAKFELMMRNVPTLQEIYAKNVFQGLTKQEIDQFVVCLQKIDHSMTEAIKEI